MSWTKAIKIVLRTSFLSCAASFMNKMHLRFPFAIVARVGITLALSLVTFAFQALPAVRSMETAPVRLEHFDLLTHSSGWILLDKHLYWTSDTGHSWDEIGPDIPAEGVIQDVEFIDPDNGWVVWTSPYPDGSAQIHLDWTTDHGRTWTRRPLDLFEPGEDASFVETVQMGWLDAQTGWIAVKQESGSNFSIGSLFTTQDEGASWSRTQLPVAGEIVFSDSQTGWAVGGPTGSQIFLTRNAGISWEDARPTDFPEDSQAFAYRPFVSSGRGSLLVNLPEEGSLRAYSLNDSSRWSPSMQVDVDGQPGLIGLSILDEQNFVAVLPGTNSILRMVDGELSNLESQDSLVESIVELDMVSTEAGWARSVDSTCDTRESSVSCTSTTRLLSTVDGGTNWTPLELPLIGSDSISIDFPVLENRISEAADNLSLNTTEIFIGQGFDRCEIPTLSQMQTWWGNSPYKVVNLYIGGSSRACSNNALISSYLFLLNQQGWKFIPTWVGPQAPCTSYLSRMSSDVNTAHTQGLTQANLAVDRLAELGLTDPQKTGSVIYYDIEAYGTNQACRDAVNAFMNGWVSQVRARGNQAGVYGSTLCNTGLSDFLNIANPPDVIWPARWYHDLGSGYYNPNASVWNLGSCIPNTAWANHQRIRQYEGDHYETWGGLTLDIDSNVLDGVVAVPYDYPFVSHILRTGASPTRAATVDFSVTFSKPVTGVNLADFALTTSSISGASLSSVIGSGATYTVTVNTGTGDGTLRLDVVDNGSILDGGTLPLGGFGIGNGNFRSGEVYSIVKSIFLDVPASHWSHEFIERLYNSGVTSGCSISPLMYCPETWVSRDQMAVFLLRGKHGSSYAPPEATGVFQDIPTDHWAADWIEQLEKEGITSGCSVNPKQYCPVTPVTRDQMAIFLLKARHGSGYVPPEVTGVFQDVPVDYWAAAWIEQLAKEGITGGCSTSPMLYCPATPVTRDQMAVFLVRAFNLP